MTLKLDVIFPSAHHDMPTIPAVLKGHRRFCTMALNWSFSAFSTGKNYMIVSSKARYDTELLKDVQQVITEKLVSVPQQPPHIRMLPQEKNLAALMELL